MNRFLVLRSPMAKKTSVPEDLIERVRAIALALPGASVKLSHDEPTFFVRKRVFCMVGLGDDRRAAAPGPRDHRRPQKALPVALKSCISPQLRRNGASALPVAAVTELS